MGPHPSALKVKDSSLVLSCHSRMCSCMPDIALTADWLLGRRWLCPSESVEDGCHNICTQQTAVYVVQLCFAGISDMEVTQPDLERCSHHRGAQARNSQAMP